MRRSSPFIRSVVKAHGLQQRSNVIGQTFAVFRVDPQKHLLSVVSKVNLFAIYIFYRFLKKIVIFR